MLTCSQTTSALTVAWMFGCLGVWTRYASSEGYCLFDLYRGTELHLPARSVGGKVNVSFKLEASIQATDPSGASRLPPTGVVTGMSGFSGLLLAKRTVDDALQQFLGR